MIIILGFVRLLTCYNIKKSNNFKTLLKKIWIENPDSLIFDYRNYAYLLTYINTKNRL